MPKAVIFDCYNTLLHYESREGKDGIWELMLATIEFMIDDDLPIAPEELKALYQKAYDKEERECQSKRGSYAEVTLARVWRDVLIQLNIPEQTAEEKAKDILMLYRLYTRKHQSLFPNVQEELMALKKHGMKLLLLSNAQTCFIYDELPEEILEIFDEVLISEEVGVKKPSEEFFRLAFEKLGTEPENIVFVGDSVEEDIIPAGKFGCPCIMIGKQKNEEDILSNVIAFDPYQESGYDGLSEIIVALNISDEI